MGGGGRGRVSRRGEGAVAASPGQPRAHARRSRAGRVGAVSAAAAAAVGSGVADGVARGDDAAVVVERVVEAGLEPHVWPGRAALARLQVRKVRGRRHAGPDRARRQTVEPARRRGGVREGGPSCNEADWLSHGKIVES